MAYKGSAERYLRELAANNPSISTIASDIADKYKRLQLHELSSVILEFVSQPLFKEGMLLLKVYEEFLVFIETSIDGLIYAQAVWAVSNQFIKPEESISFLDTISNRIASPEGKIYLQIGKGYYYLKQDLKEEARVLIMSCEKMIKENSSMDSLVHSFHYQLCALYHAKLKNYDQFYKYGLQYLAYVPAKLMTPEEKAKWSYDMAISVLLGPTIYNISELLDKEILKILPQTQHKWIYDILLSLNNGNISEFNNAIEKYKEIISKQEQISANLPTLKLKVRILQLIELIFLREKGNRNITFKTISQECQVAESEVEWLLMKAMSLNLIKGEIDEIEGVIRITWVIPRYLDKKRTVVLKSKFSEWKDKTSKVLKNYEDIKSKLDGI